MPSSRASKYPPSHRRLPILFKVLWVFVLIGIFVNIQLYLIQIYSSPNFSGICFSKNNNSNNCDCDTSRIKNGNEIPTEYLVYTSNCQLLNLNPFHRSALTYVTKEPRKDCDKTTLVLLQQTLKLNSTWLLLPENDRPRCCFRRIERKNQDPNNYTSSADDRFSISKTCYNISIAANGTKVPINYEFIRTECQIKINDTNLLNLTAKKPYTNKQKNIILTNFYAIVYKPEEHSNKTKEKVKFWKNYIKIKNIPNSNKSSSFKKSGISSSGSVSSKRLPPSVLIFGIDGTSRLQSIRSLPHTREFLFENDFIEFKGYTRTGENTFPNMMAALGGMENNNYPCSPNKSTKLDDCPFIWKNFCAINYVTGMAEDSGDTSVFDYLKTGFVEPPTDYYLRPFTTAYYGFHKVSSSEEYHGCVQGVSLTKHLLQYMDNFIKVHQRKVPYFYYTWFGSVAHHSFNALRAEDNEIYEFFKHHLYKDASKKFPKSEEEDNTIIFFISDHGSRLHPIRYHFQGYFEESLPFVFVRLPPSIKRSHPHWYENLKINSNRLSSPLDLHATLEDIVSLSQNQLNLQETPTTASKKDIRSLETRYTSRKQKPESLLYTHSNSGNSFRSVYSFFEETPENRSCESSKIPDMYCRCGIRTSTSSYSPLAKEFALAIVEKVNQLLEAYIYPKSHDCVQLQYRDVIYTRELDNGALDTDRTSYTSNNESFYVNSPELTDTNQKNQTNSHLHIIKANYTDFIVGVKVKPSNAIFEARIQLIEELQLVNNTSTTTTKKKFFKLVGGVSRVNRYKGQSHCVSDSRVIMYCYCTDLLSRKKKKRISTKLNRTTSLVLKR